VALNGWVTVVIALLKALLMVFMVHTMCGMVEWRVHRARAIRYQNVVLVRTSGHMPSTSCHPAAIVVVAMPGCARFVPTKT